MRSPKFLLGRTDFAGDIPNEGADPAIGVPKREHEEGVAISSVADRIDSRGYDGGRPQKAAATKEGGAVLRPYKGSRPNAGTISELPRFAWPTLALLALLMLALLAWPAAASAQGPAGAGGQQPPASDQQQQPNPTAQQGSPVSAAPQASPQVGGPDAPAQQPTIRPQQPLTPEAVLGRIIAQEQAEVGLVRQYSPLVETYVQYIRPDKTTGAAPDGDRYFLGRAELSRGVDLMPLDKDASLKHRAIGSWSEFLTSQFLPRGFLQMIFIDMNDFNQQHYRIEYVRREFLGEVRCLVFDVDPAGSKDKKDKGRFVGRIWVEDQDFHIVRFNGAYGGASLTSNYFNFDSWRTNVGKNLWLPSFIYSEEGSIHDKRSLNIGYKVFRAQTRLWGYDLGHAKQEQELNKVLVEAAGVHDADGANDYSPLQSERSWSHQAEDNVTDRLERMGLLAPYGEVDKVLETVVNNLEVTNNLDIQPDIRCRVLMTSTLESFTVGHTIVLSRGLIDVLPDEASLGAILAHELGHVVLGHKIDSQYAFFSRVRFDDKDAFKHFDFSRTPEEEEAAQQKGIALLKNSPYKDKASSAQAFLQAVRSRAKEIPNLISPHLGDRVSASWAAASAVFAGQPGADKEKDASSEKAGGAPEAKVDKNVVAALPLGGRIKIDPWNDQLRMLKSKPVGTVGEAENTPFQITPFMFYLTRVADNSPAPMMTSATPAPGVAAAQMDAPPKPEITQDLPGRPAPEPRKP
ncbi:MAG TPA: M48 family metalloprotease [Candidatus Acidoferrum sp.]|nr:M48 family metalloprotease [Candidatus Acidoferrum sp.]